MSRGSSCLPAVVSENESVFGTTVPSLHRMIGDKRQQVTNTSGERARLHTVCPTNGNGTKMTRGAPAFQHYACWRIPSFVSVNCSLRFQVRAVAAEDGGSRAVHAPTKFLSDTSVDVSLQPLARTLPCNGE